MSRELDEKVAKVLGWKQSELHPHWWMPPGAKRWHTINFTSDPAAADLVIKEIERRGWEWEVSRYLTGYCADVQERGSDGAILWNHPTDSAESQWHALCLAFLAAVEATKEQAQ